MSNVTDISHAGFLFTERRLHGFLTWKPLQFFL